MSAVTGIVAGFVTAAGALALYRYAQRRTGELRDRIEKARRRGAARNIIDFEQDPETGIYHAK